MDYYNEWTVQGSHIYADDDIDTRISIEGAFETETHKRIYLNNICEALNKYGRNYRSVPFMPEPTDYSGSADHRENESK